MLLELYIKSLAVIDELQIDFNNGLNILTGETGAGKSIILNALQLILGERASAELIRTGDKKSGVEAVFSVNDKDLKTFLELNNLIDEDEPDKLILRREVSISGNNKCFINGILVPLSYLRQVGDFLVDLHGQHQHQSLLKTESQRNLLDAYGNLNDQVKEFSENYEDLIIKIKKLHAAENNKLENERKKDFIKYQLEEINKANLKKGEDEDIEKELKKLKHAERLKKLSSLCYDLLYEGESTSNPIINLISQVESEVREISSLDDEAVSLVNDISEILLKIENLSASIREYRDNISEDPDSLSALESRRDLLRDLKKKYGSTISYILDYAETIKNELFNLENTEIELASLKTEIEQLILLLTKDADEISNKRKSAAKKLEKQMNSFLRALNLPHAKFIINFKNYDEDENEIAEQSEEKILSDNNENKTEQAEYYNLPFKKFGRDKIEFLFCANPGEELRPLKKVASGGEISRIMLALKSQIAAKDQVPTIVFDEIDVGIGGETSDRVGRKMAQIGKNCQVICITHLPQIACYADSHYTVKKIVQNNRTYTTVKKIEKEESKEEIARMIGGDEITKVSLKQAEEFIKRKNEI